jgi:hypothetical protein
MNKEPEEGFMGRGGARESCATNKAVNGCPSLLIKLAQSDFERAVVQEFIEIEEKCEKRFSKLESDIEFIARIAKFGVPILTALIVAILIKVLVNH